MRYFNRLNYISIEIIEQMGGAVVSRVAVNAPISQPSSIWPQAILGPIEAVNNPGVFEPEHFCNWR